MKKLITPSEVAGKTVELFGWQDDGVIVTFTAVALFAIGFSVASLGDHNRPARRRDSVRHKRTETDLEWYYNPLNPFSPWRTLN